MDTKNISTENKAHLPKVSVCVVTYNQEEYIHQCLQSLVDQVTDFNFEILVADDCSADGTRKIIEGFTQRHPEIVKPIFHKKNLGPYQNYIFIHQKAKGEYIAHMDGDDYALPGKLQSQADYLDRHPECAVVWHRMKVLDPNTRTLVDDLINVNLLPKNGFFQRDLLGIGTIGFHSSKMYRKISAPTTYPSGSFIDYYVDVENLNYGTGFILDHILGTYRANIGISNQNNNTRILLINHLLLFYKKYPDFKAYIFAHAFRLFLGDLMKMRNTLPLSFKVAFSCFHLFGFLHFIRMRKYFYIFRLPF